MNIITGLKVVTCKKDLSMVKISHINVVDKFPTVELYTRNVVKTGRDVGYVTTLLNRRRYIPNINSHVPSLRHQAQRQAVNFTIQGKIEPPIRRLKDLIQGMARP